ncbi:hypothetical protein M0R45_034992 [Rubus argutus]|uniref:Uncharacterized protein n=1 Tax=Rubus argutus TaxID=59490 RepID=A0AAW1VRU7_RUBAR
MASTSTVSPNKSILQTHNHDVPLSQLKWIIKNPSGHSRRSGNHTQLVNHDSAAELPDPNSSNEETPTDQNQAPEAEAETEVEDQNPSSAAAAVSALASEEAEEVLPKTWNLRPRKTVPKPNGEASALKTGAPVVQYNKIQEAVPSRGTKGGQKKKKKEKRMEISLTLTKEEIEEDIYIMTGQKPSRRPKRRPKNVQKQLDNLSPGMFLDEVSVGSYRVHP